MTLKPNNLHVYNTLVRDKVRFEPVAPPRVGIYVCGPTVYGDAHIGHAKSYISFDVIVRYLRHLGYGVTYVQNITDVGHLTDDADQGEDKVERKARAERIHPMQLAEGYTRSYFEDMDRLNVARPDISPRASGHIIEQIELVKRLLAAGHAYEAGGNVYFDVASWPAYGKLSGRAVEEMQSGTRVEVAADKRHPADFALWKKAEAGHIMQWPSPWGQGFPGWHLECSAMSMKYLGETFDIHGGGLENSFPHHEDEIAQAEAATGKPFAKYWLHNNMVTVGGQKMGKSLGNFITLKDAYKKWDPMVLRLFILQSHYRSPLDFSDEALGAAKEGYDRLKRAFGALFQASLGGKDGPVTPAVLQVISEQSLRLMESMDDDFNSPRAVAVLFDLAREVNTLLAGQDYTRETLIYLQSATDELASGILGLHFREGPIATKQAVGQLLDKVLSLPSAVMQDATKVPIRDGRAMLGNPQITVPVSMMASLLQMFIDQRNDARKSKNFAQADAIRKRLDEIGILLEDSPQGTKWRFK